MIASTRLFLLRHAEVEEKYHRTFGGRIDMDLSPRGHDQAAALALYLKGTCFDAIYASPMKRALQTLDPLQKQCGLTPVFLEELREVHFGDWTGLTWQEVHDRYQVSAYQWLDYLEEKKIPNAEHGAVFRQRVEPALRQILEAHPGQQVAVIAHGGVIRMILSILLELPLIRLAAVDIEYASLSFLDWSPGRMEVRLLNFTPWRDLPQP